MSHINSTIQTLALCTAVWLLNSDQSRHKDCQNSIYCLNIVWKNWTICLIHMHTKPKGPSQKCSVRICVLLHPYGATKWSDIHFLLELVISCNILTSATVASAARTELGFMQMRTKATTTSVRFLLETQQLGSAIASDLIAVGVKAALLFHPDCWCLSQARTFI